MKDYAAKIAENLARLAALFHFFEGGEGEISSETVERATAVSIWYGEEFKRLFAAPPALSQEEADANLLESWLKNYARENTLSLRRNDIRRSGPELLRTKGRLDSALHLLFLRGVLSFSVVNRTNYVHLMWSHFARW